MVARWHRWRKYRKAVRLSNRQYRAHVRAWREKRYDEWAAWYEVNK